VFCNDVVLLHFEVLQKFRLVSVPRLEKGKISDGFIFLKQIVVACSKVFISFFHYLDFTEPFEFFD
jgi:hypothetical protein